MRNKINPKRKIIKVKKITEIKDSVPELRLRGKWLKSNGFYEEMQVEVIYGFEYLVIYPYKKESL